MTAKTLSLPVRASGYDNSPVRQLLRRSRDCEMIKILIRCLQPPYRTRLQNMRRHEMGEYWMFPDVRFLIPVLLRSQATESNDQGRRISDISLPPELEHVVVQFRLRQVVFDRTIAIRDHRQVRVIQRTTLRDHQHPFLAGRGCDLLTLIASRLVIVFYTDSPLGFEPPNVLSCIVD